MIPAIVRNLDEPVKPARHQHRRFGLDAPLPADRQVIERAILRHIREYRRSVVVLGLGKQASPQRDRTAYDAVQLAAGAPDLLLLMPGGRVAFLTIKTQAQDLSRAQRAFGDVCRERAIPLHVVRSLAEARRALDHLGVSSSAKDQHA